MSRQDQHLEEIIKTVAEYKNNFNSYDSAKIQDIRDKLSLSLYYLIGHYTELKIQLDAAEYNKKVAYAQICEVYRGRKDEVTGKNYTREQITDKATIESQKDYLAVMEASKNFYNIKFLFDEVHSILNSISSRIALSKNTK